jgi:hypothetical protein
MAGHDEVIMSIERDCIAMAGLGELIMNVRSTELTVQAIA